MSLSLPEAAVYDLDPEQLGKLSVGLDGHPGRILRTAKWMRILLPCSPAIC